MHTHGRLDRGITGLGKLVFMHSLLGFLWVRVFESELHANTMTQLARALDAGAEVNDDDGEITVELLVAQYAQGVEQGIRVTTTAQWLRQTCAPDLALSRICHKPIQALIDELLWESSMAFGEEQRVKLDTTGSRTYRIVLACKGTAHLRALAALGRLVMGEGPWQLFTAFVGKSGMSAFSAFRVVARSAGTIYIRFEVRRESHPLKCWRVLDESTPDEIPQDTACTIVSYLVLAAPKESYSAGMLVALAPTMGPCAWNCTVFNSQLPPPLPTSPFCLELCCVWEVWGFPRTYI